jgi:hypothetical protein
VNKSKLNEFLQGVIGIVAIYAAAFFYSPHHSIESDSPLPWETMGEYVDKKRVGFFEKRLQTSVLMFYDFFSYGYLSKTIEANYIADKMIDDCIEREEKEG